MPFTCKRVLRTRNWGLNWRIETHNRIVNKRVWVGVGEREKNNQKHLRVILLFLYLLPLPSWYGVDGVRCFGAQFTGTNWSIIIRNEKNAIATVTTMVIALDSVRSKSSQVNEKRTLPAAQYVLYSFDFGVCVCCKRASLEQFKFCWRLI